MWEPCIELCIDIIVSRTIDAPSKVTRPGVAESNHRSVDIVCSLSPPPLPSLSGRYHGEVAERTSAGKIAQELVGSWQVSVGDQDQCIHLWKYNGGYKAVDDARNAHVEEKVRDAGVVSG